MPLCMSGLISLHLQPAKTMNKLGLYDFSYYFLNFFFLRFPVNFRFVTWQRESLYLTTCADIN